MQKLDPKAVWIFFFQFAFAGITILFLYLWFFGPIILKKFLSSGQLLSTSTAAFLVIMLSYLIFCFVWAKLTYKFWLYDITEDAYKMEQGVIYKRYVSIPYERIQNVDIHRGIIARLLGLSELRIQTAGFGGAQGKWGAWSEGRLPGIDKEKAEQLREQLISKLKGKKQGL